jgi:5'-3' exonuclease
MKILIDGDILAYRAAYYCEDKDPEDGEHKIDDLVDRILEATTFAGGDDVWEMFITGKGNFRHDFQPTYKAQRKERPKPIFLGAMRQYLIEDYNAKVSEGQEADDDIAIRATELGPSTIIASIDKDFLQVPCGHYNFNRGTLVTVEEFEGLQFVYGQILTGDSADNVGGLMGIGPVKSKKMLAKATTERELYDLCVKAYKGDEEKVIENARLLWLRREEGQVLQPPEAS